MKRRSSFGAEFYERFYGNPRTAVTSRLNMRRRAEFIGAFARYADFRVRRILDAGCGLGWMRTPLLEQFPGAQYTGLEVSEYLCGQYGWTQGSLVTYKPRVSFDLVVCYDVLQYLKEVEARRAMANLGRVTGGLLYFSALTQNDWDFYCDKRLTDPDVYIREGEWYRERLNSRFRALGGGLFLRKGVDVQLWDLERVG